MASMLRTVFHMPLDGEDSEEDFTANLNPVDTNLSDSGDEDCAIDMSKKGKAAMSYKAQVHEMHTEMLALKCELAGLKNTDLVEELPGTYSKPKEGRRAHSMSKSHHEDSLVAKICQLRGKFTIMYMLWMSNPSIEWKRQGEQADLCEVFPTQFHRMSNKHSNSASRIHNRVGPHIFNCQLDQFSQPEWCYENCQELIGWQEGVEGPMFYSLFAPILYLDYKGWHDMKKVFLNQSLFNIFNVIIHGTGTLNQEPGAKSTEGAVMNDIIWELKEVMLGAIAASAVFAHFALSNNLSFQHQGSASGIDYEVDFNIYLKYLISSHTQNQHSVKQIFSIWNNYFFPGTIWIEAIRAVPAHTLNDMFAALNEDSSGDE
ncbi:hypothetical protein K439DRAFT_1619672 [Ramaria rubella]|nr:hypothetical protein K439DRAFT_1619672 [Ramaria rubella]